MKAVIHVHQQLAKKRDPLENPAIIIRTYKGSTHHREVHVDGPLTFLHTVEPDSCGATITAVCEYESIVSAVPPLPDACVG